MQFFSNDTATSKLEDKLRIPFMLEIPGETVQWLFRERDVEIIKARLLGKLMMVFLAKEKWKKRSIKKQNP